MSGKWVSKPAVLWVMDEAPGVPAHLFAALVAVARYADESGRGAYPSAQTVAAIIRKTPRNAEKDLAALRRLGLLLPGDQRIVKDIRADRRPVVYDLPMPRSVAQVPSDPSHTTDKEVLKTSGIPRAPDGAARGARETPPLDGSGAPRAVTKIKIGSDGRDAGHLAPLAHGCPWCNAHPGQSCKVAGRRRDPHPARVEAAERGAAPRAH